MPSGGYGDAEGEPKGRLPKAVEISGAGSQDVNGLYKASSKEYCDAPVYEHAECGQELKITREPHKNPKTGAIKHGWLLGQRGQPLYGVPTEALAVPSTGWRKFTGEEPIPEVKIYWSLDDLLFVSVDESKSAGESAREKQDLAGAVKHFTAGIDSLKKATDQLGDAFTSRASSLLLRRASTHLELKDFKAALRDSVAALELAAPDAEAYRILIASTAYNPASEGDASALSVPGAAVASTGDASIASIPEAAVAVALDAMKELGFQDKSVAAKILEPIGSGRILDPAAPLVLRCVDRWIDDISAHFLNAIAEDPQLPTPIHMPSDRYLDGLDEETRQAVIKKYVPEQQFGGNATLSSPAECMELMKKWEEVFSGADFQSKRKALWDRKDLSFPARLMATRTMVADSVSPVLEPMGFAPGRPGLARCVKQMQIHWSSDRACANKALDLEELADVSLADLE